MDRRTLLTLSTAACLCATYEAYALFISPLFSPAPDSMGGRMKRSDDQIPYKPPENRRQAERFLADQPWASESPYQFRNSGGFFYFQEWENVEDSGEASGKVRFHPFAMIWRPNGHDPKTDPYTIFSESAIVEFAEKFDIKKVNVLRVVGGALDGKVRIRGPNGLLIDGKDFIFSDIDKKVWSDHTVSFAQGPHTGRGKGLELDLIRAEGRPGDEKETVTGVQTLRLRKEVKMELVSESKSKAKPDETVFVNCQGSFKYDVEINVATFENAVVVNRPTGNAQSDLLKCELLTLYFEPDETPKAEDIEAKPDASQPPPSEPPGTFGGKLTFRRLRAEGPVVSVVSQRSDMDARMNELTYDAQARVITLRDARQVRLVQRNNKLLCPEVTAVLDEDGEIERAICRGAGKLFNYANDSESKGKRSEKKTVALAAVWQQQLQKIPDPRTGLDLIEFKGRAVLSQAGKMSLQADLVRIWVTRGASTSSAPAVTDGSTAPTADDRNIQPKQMLALREVAFASPQISGHTERLEVWFEEGSLPIPPQAEDSPVAPQSVLRPVSRRGQRMAAAGGDASRKSTPAKKPPSQATPPEQKKADREPVNPLVVDSDVIQVRALRERDGDDPQVAEVITEGHVHVSQQHAAGVTPLDLTGERLHLWNYSESNQVLDVTGLPAHVQDRGMQIEGPRIHFDRGRNLAQVKGAGVLRLPMTKGLDGKPLETSQLLDVFWQEKMDFDGEVANFYKKVRTQLNGSEMQCGKMHVTFAKRVSFGDNAPNSQQTDVKLIVCRDGVNIKSHEYDNNRLMSVRTATGFEFTFNRISGLTTAQGPGMLADWRRGNGKRAALEASSEVRANRALVAEAVEWEYTRIDFDGQMEGNANQRLTTFHDRVRVVYGPVENSTAELSEESLPKDGGWMHSDELQLTQHPATKKQRAYLELEASQNVMLHGRSFHAMAHTATYDESKGLYVLTGDGKNNAKIWLEKKNGGSPDMTEKQRLEFIPAKNYLNTVGVAGGQGGP